MVEGQTPRNGEGFLTEFYITRRVLISHGISSISHMILLMSVGSYRYDDNDGRGLYRKLPLHAAGLRAGESGAMWNGYAPNLHNRHWATPSRGAMHRYIIEHDLIPNWPDAYPSVHDRLEALDNCGLMIHSDAYLPEIKTYLAATNGVAATDFVADISMTSGNEKTGYATQKPLALYERIIKASSNPGDVVLDIFAGCATTAVAAERLERQWLACDIAYRSWTMLKRRILPKRHNAGRHNRRNKRRSSFSE